jgi:hypothetical protein
VSELKITDLTTDELADLEAQGRLDRANNRVLEPPKPDNSPAAPLPTGMVPAMPDGVKERLAAKDTLASSFVQKDTKGTVQAASPDGGKEAEEAAKRAEEARNADWVGKPKEDPVEYEDKLRFLAHLLGAERFTKTYELFGGQLVLTFQTRTAEEEGLCNDQAWMDEKVHSLGASNSPEAVQGRLNRFMNYRMTAALKAMGRKGDRPIEFTPFKDRGELPPHVTPIRVSYDELLKLPGPVMVVVQQAHHRFESLVARLTLAADKPDFWKADSGT